MKKKKKMNKKMKIHHCKDRMPLEEKLYSFKFQLILKVTLKIQKNVQQKELINQRNQKFKKNLNFFKITFLFYFNVLFIQILKNYIKKNNNVIKKRSYVNFDKLIILLMFY